jgi:hypothetical protein
MKKIIFAMLFVLAITVTLVSCSKNFFKVGDPPPTGDGTFCFDSVQKLEEFLLADTIYDNLGNAFADDAEIEMRCGAEFLKFKNAFAEGSNKLKVPYFAEEAEYEHIVIFGKELYGLPCISFRFNIGDCNVWMRTLYMGDEFEEMAKETEFPELLKQIRPDAPNVHNKKEYKEYKAIYGCDMNIGGERTSVLVCEVKNKERVFVLFAYEDMVVVLRGNDKLLSDGFLENLTFSEVAK